MELIFLIVLGVIIAYVFILYKIEKMADTSSTTDQIKQAVKEVYLADVEAIRNLSETATKLQAGGLTVPGNTNFSGNITTKGAIKFSEWGITHPDDADGAIYKADGQLQIAVDDLLRFRNIGSKTHKIEFNTASGSATFGGDNTSIWLNSHGNGDARFNGDVSSAGVLKVDRIQPVLETEIGDGKRKGFLSLGGERVQIDGNLNVNNDLKVRNRNILAELDRLNRILPDDNTLRIGKWHIYTHGDEGKQFTIQADGTDWNIKNGGIYVLYNNGRGFITN